MKLIPLALLTKAALPHLKASKGAVLNISATLHYTGKAFQLHFGAAKAAIDALTTHWAVELGPHGIRKYLSCLDCHML